mgnify:CR=1 FL=1|tara:strand:- start:1633 stop:2226 length:594 start_codon:yes stop_codon:yes gene_type:complete
MATIKLCDWTKERIGKDEPTYRVTVEEDTFEVSDAGMTAIINQLEGEDAPGTPKVEVVERVVHRDAPPPPLEGVGPGGVQIQVADEPFDSGPSSAPQPAQAAPAPLDPASMNSEDLLEIPEDPKKRFRTPSKVLAQRIIEEATKFREGTLPALTVGDQQQRDAAKRLRTLEDKQEESLRRKGGRDFNVNQNLRDPGH